MTHFLKKLTQSDILEKFRKLRFHHFRGVWCRYIFNVGTIVIPISNRDSKMIFRTDAFSSVSDRLQSESQNWVENWILRKSGRFKKLWSNFSFYDGENVIYGYTSVQKPEEMIHYIDYGCHKHFSTCLKLFLTKWLAIDRILLSMAGKVSEHFKIRMHMVMNISIHLRGRKRLNWKLNLKVSFWND